MFKIGAQTVHVLLIENFIGEMITIRFWFEMLQRSLSSPEMLLPCFRWMTEDTGFVVCVQNQAFPKFP